MSFRGTTAAGSGGEKVVATYSMLGTTKIRDLVATNDKETAKEYIKQGYTLFAVPQMFGECEGVIILYLEEAGHDHRAPKQMSEADALQVLSDFETASQGLYRF
jgi:hypothetical protein